MLDGRVFSPRVQSDPAFPIQFCGFYEARGGIKWTNESLNASTARELIPLRIAYAPILAP